MLTQAQHAYTQQTICRVLDYSCGDATYAVIASFAVQHYGASYSDTVAIHASVYDYINEHLPDLGYLADMLADFCLQAYIDQYL